MAHELENDHMAYVGAVPWHGLGVKVDENISANEMLVAAGLDWTVQKHSQFIEFSDGNKIETGQKALVRSSDNVILTYVSDGWEPVQNSEAFEFFHDFVAAGNMKMHTAGSLKQGKRVWGLAKLEEDFEILGKDKIESYLLFSNPHEYGKSVDIRYTSTRVVCQNTLTMALQGNSDIMIKLNHSRKFDVDLAKRTMSLAHKKTEQFKEAAEFLSTKRFEKEEALAFFSYLFPKKEEVVLPESITSMFDKKDSGLSRTGQKVFDLMETQPGAEFGEGTWWQAFNAVTFATNHVLGRSNDTRMTSAWYGANRDKNIQALNKALEFANAS